MSTYIPSPERIALECAKIQSEWDLKKEMSRRGSIFIEYEKTTHKTSKNIDIYLDNLS